jgi:DNA-binding beta-propeller fold protein YncE
MLVVAAMASVVGFPGAGVVLANGLGDLYVATAGGVDEVYLLGNEVVTTVDIKPGRSRLAFTADGATLYAGDGADSLVRINIKDIAVDKQFTLPGHATAIVHPRGNALLLAYPDSKSLGVLFDGDDAPIAGASLPGAANLLAADPRETRVVAAESGAGWVAIVQPFTSTVTRVDVGGDVGAKIEALAVARDEGGVYVASTAPDRLSYVDFATGKVAWTAALDGAPVAVAAIPSAAIVAIGGRLVRVAAGEAKAWATTPADVTDLAASYEGKFLYAATGKTVVAIAVAAPTAPPAASVDIASGAPMALAPVPKASTLVTEVGTGTGTGHTGTGPGQTASGGSAGGTAAPATDTEDGGPLFRKPAADQTWLFGTAALIALVVALVSRYALKRVVEKT